MKKRIREVLVVEGRYDKNTLSQIVDAVIIPLNGFAVFHDRDKLMLLRRLAKERGLIILTDSDNAGFVIRNYLKGILPKEQIKQAYIPDIYGKERRKQAPGKEGKLGVEGMKPQVLLDALRQCGATFESEPELKARNEFKINEKKGGYHDVSETVNKNQSDEITKADFMAWGLSGGSDSAVRRKQLLHHLNLPEHLTANAMLEILNLLYSREMFLEEFHALFEMENIENQI